MIKGLRLVVLENFRSQPLISRKFRFPRKLWPHRRQPDTLFVVTKPRDIDKKRNVCVVHRKLSMVEGKRWESSGIHYVHIVASSLVCYSILITRFRFTCFVHSHTPCVCASRCTDRYQAARFFVSSYLRVPWEMIIIMKRKSFSSSCPLRASRLCCLLLNGSILLSLHLIPPILCKFIIVFLIILVCVRVSFAPCPREIYKVR